MTKGDLLRLADLLELDYQETDSGVWTRQDPTTRNWTKKWEPHNNLNQAFECLEGWKKEDINRKAFIRVTSSYDGGDYSVCLSNYNIESNKSLSLAICNAILEEIK